MGPALSASITDSKYYMSVKTCPLACVNVCGYKQIFNNRETMGGVWEVGMGLCL